MTKPTLESITETHEARGTISSTTSIKDAYCEWLRDVDTSTRKRKNKKKSKRLVALRHLTQPTESSAKKQFQAPEAITRTTTESSDDDAASRREAQRRRFQSRADGANYAQFTYESPWLPGLAFFGLLAAQAEARSLPTGPSFHRNASHSTVAMRREIANFPVQVPPTVMRRSRPSRGIVVFFTVGETREPEQDTAFANHKLGRDKAAAVTATDWTLQCHYVSTWDVFESRLPWILRVLSTGDSVPRAVLKETTATHGNHVRALDSLAAIEEALRSLWENAETSDAWSAVQTYVASKGSSGGGGGGKAWIARPAYRKKDQSAAAVWILTGSGPLFATTEWEEEVNTPPPCQIVKCTTAQSWQQPRVILETLCQWLDVHVLRPGGVGSFAELVVDLVQDAHGVWWLLQIKAFQLRRSQLLLPPAATGSRATSRAKSAPDRLETLLISSSSLPHSKTKWKCAGQYCHTAKEDAFNNQASRNDAPSGFLTKKELLSCAFSNRVHTSNDASLSGGCGSFASALQFYLQHQLSKRDRTVLYEPQALCDACIHKYYALRTDMTTLMEAEAGHESSKKVLPLQKTSKLTTAKSLAALPLAGKLPALQVAPPRLRVRQSTPAIASSGTPSYMDELERIDNLLADDQQYRPAPPSLLPPKVSSTTPSDSPAKTTFSWQETTHKANRVDAMWDSLQLKPLTHATHAYNTFSLQAALRESPIPSDEPTTRSTRTDPHLISLVDCRRVFADEPFREAIVRETMERLVVHHQAVRFVVMPAEDDDDKGVQDPSLGRMALRTLALDIHQSLARDGVSVGPRGLPAVTGDAAGSGCLFMTVPVPPSSSSVT